MNQNEDPVLSFSVISFSKIFSIFASFFIVFGPKYTPKNVLLLTFEILVVETFF